MNALLLLITLATSTLVLRSGDRIAVEGTPVRENGVVTFRSAGQLYSMPESEIVTIEETPEAPPAPAVKKLRLSEEERQRLIEQLEQNHASNAAPAPLAPIAEVLPKPQQPPGDEWSWRRAARAHEEDIRRAKEDVALLETRAEELRNQINTFFALGYRAQQFTYQSTQLARIEERLPEARLEVTRAERAWELFRDDARKQDVPPGWLR